MTIQRPGQDEYSPYYQLYVECVPDGDLLAMLGEQLNEVRAVVAGIGEDRAAEPYAPGKWSTKDVLLHIADTERVMAYRALRVARGDTTPLASFEQDDYVRSAGADGRSLESLVAELAAVRAATIELLRNLDAEELARLGTASGHPVSARALAFIIAGHERHHMRILREQPGLVTTAPLASA